MNLRVGTIDDRLDTRRSRAIGLAGNDPAVAARVATAPPAYALAHGPSDIVRHAALLTPVPSGSEVRSVLTPGVRSGEWRLDVIAFDRPGLLAACTGVLAALGIEVIQAVLATWDDGAALEAFVVRSAVPPDATEIGRRCAAALDQPLWSPPVPDAHIVFSDDASPLYTACTVTAADQPGLLHAIAVAITAAGADVHAARVDTDDGVARDHFDLADRAGNRLDAAACGTIRAIIARGASPA